MADVTKNVALFLSDLGADVVIETGRVLNPTAEKFKKLYTDNNGDWAHIAPALTVADGFTPEIVKGLRFTNDLFVVSNKENPAFVQIFKNETTTHSLHDVALLFNKAAFTEKIKTANAQPPNVVVETYAADLYKNLFQLEPTAMVQRMVKSADETLIADAVLRGGVSTFLANQPETFNIKKTSVHEAFRQPDAFKNIAPELQDGVKTTMKTLQRVVAISPDAVAVKGMMQSNITSAFQVSDIPQAQFVKTYAASFGKNGDVVAQQVHENATNARIVGEQVLMALKEAGQKTGIAFIDKSLSTIPQNPTPALRGIGDAVQPTTSDPQQIVNEALKKYDLSWNTLFGDADFCDCGECTSVYSAAAYFVDLLQYLRNNNLDPNATDTIAIRSRANDISGTPLQKLFDRRPDLGRLELTCANINTILPYVDLVNEVMESYVVHGAEAETAKRIIPYNVADETSGELLSEPQHTEYAAYNTLKDAVYPFTLPYHQPIDATRVYLNHLDTSRYELMDTFRTSNQSGDVVLTRLKDEALQRAIDAEFLGITETEYVTLTQEGFESKALKDKALLSPMTDAAYKATISLKETYQYYGFNAEADMLDSTTEKGLTYIKKQLLPRTGILFTDLVELLKTQYINPNGSIVATPLSSCDLDVMRLLHLDGSAVTKDEYDRLHRFIRLWRKLSWTIDETDKAIMGLNAAGTINKISADLIHQLVAVQKLLDRTGLELTKLLSFWTTISTAGEKSLYQRLFLTHNVQGIDKVFIADANGNFLKQNEKISNHKPVLMAALNLNGDDLAALYTAFGFNDDTPLLLENVSAFYRVRLFAKAVGIHVPEFVKIVQIAPLTTPPSATKLFDNPFTDANTTLNFMTQWQRMEDAGFNFKQLNYIVKDTDDAQKPFEPSEKAVLILAKTLYDGLNAIDEAHKDVAAITVFKLTDSEAVKAEVTKLEIEGQATSELVRSKAALLFDPSVVDKILGILEGTTVYSTVSPKGVKDLSRPIPLKAPNTIQDYEFLKFDNYPILSQKIKYDSTNGSLQIRGILTQVEKTEFNAVLGHILQNVTSPPLSLTDSLTDIEKQQKRLFREVLFAVFETENEAEEVIINGGDINADSLVDKNTSAPKCAAFLKIFLPYLRNELTHRFIDDTLAGLVGLDRQTTDVLITEILKTVSTTKPIYDIFEKIKDRVQDNSTNWNGCLIPSTEENYTFIIKNTNIMPPLSINEVFKIDGVYEKFIPSEDTTNEWWSSKPIKLQAGKLYPFSLTNIDLKNVYWKTATSSISVLPPSVLLPDFAGIELKPAFVALKKAAMIATGFNLSADEMRYFNTNSAQFDNLNFNDLRLKSWLRLEAYTRLRNSLPQTKTTILDFLKWTLNPTPPSVLTTKIAELTLWNPERVKKLIIAPHFNLDNPVLFRNEINLLKLQNAMTVTDKIGMDVNLLFDWAKPMADFQKCRENADSIRHAIRIRYNQTDWEEVVKPLSNQLRENQKNALIAYILQQQPLLDWGVTDADGLFEFFLIDVQMDACMETSRIKQAISSVQTFVQRCFLGLEEKKDVTGKEIGVDNIVLDRDRWEWMQRFRVWEANRKVFIYPENWIESNLRDDKSPFFKELESELLQKDINKQNVTDALKAYLYKVDEVANLEVVGMYIESNQQDGKWKNGDKLHVFARSRNAPYFFFYRYLALDEMNWSAWEKMQVDIPSYDTELVTNERAYVLTGKLATLNGVSTFTTEVFSFNYTPLQITSLNITQWEDIENKVGNFEGIITIDGMNGSIKGKAYKYEYERDPISNEIGGLTHPLSVSSSLINPSMPIEPNNPVPSSPISDPLVAVDSPSTLPLANTINFLLPTYFFDAVFTRDKSNNGCYLTPIVWNNRLLIFFPQLMKKVKPTVHKKVIDATNDANIRDLSDKTPDSLKPIEYWEIKMAWSEYRNGKWTQKQLSLDAATTTVLNEIEDFKFIPNVTESSLVIEVRNTMFQLNDNPNNAPKDIFHQFEFNGSQIRYLNSDTHVFDHGADLPNFFQKHTHNDLIVKPVLVNNNNWVEPVITHDDDITSSVMNLPDKVNFYHPFTHSLLGKINTGQLKDFFEYNLNSNIDKDDAFGIYDPDNDTATNNSIYHELKRPYALYNWELFFHTPMMLADALSKAQQFEEAMKWYHYVFSPMADGTNDKRFWQFSPFKDTDSKRILDSIFNNLAANASDQRINEWRNNPFKPHLVARSRPVAYMKWVVMKYIDNIIAWGDSLFRQDTIESINQATQLYVLAGHILGDRPQMIPRRAKTKPQTYLSLLDKWDANGDAMSDLSFLGLNGNPSNQPTSSGNSDVGHANIFGSASALYFCIPNNPKLMAYWDTIADRLFKIRHCENIEGIFRKLPLFEPPIDPALLVNAAAQGLSISSVLNDLNTPMPNYRFYYLLQKALELCNELKSLGSAMLSAIEKKDNETIALIRAKHESTMNNLVMEIKKQQLEEANKSLESLLQNRKTAEERMTYYLKLSGLEESSIPSSNAEFNGLPNDIEKPVDEGGLKVNKYEKEEMDYSWKAFLKQDEIGQLELLASIYHLYPSIRAATEPLGVGASFEFGGPFLGGAVQAYAKAIQNNASGLTFNSTNAGRKSGFQRAIQDRIFQANAAGYEIKQIDKQIVSQQIRIAIANQEITNQQKMIDNAQEIEDFLKYKYTNEELYTWMRGSLKTLYHQVYGLAFDLAKKAEKTFRFERGLSSSNFIQAGYWNESYDGLLSGEQLYVGLKQLEAAYQENRGYDYEVTKHISLRQINPIAILQLKETGTCEFELPEVLFDMDYPGQFKRRIKSVSLSIPCVAGPYTNVNATLRLLSNKFRNTAVSGKKYEENTEETDARFSSFIIPISAIAASSAQNDGGMFELNFKDERYLPFEGAGVASKWRLELPNFRQFDYDTISDAVVHLRYISTEGGDRLKNAASGARNNFLKSTEELGQRQGLFAIIDLQHDLPTEWHKAMQVNTDDTTRTVIIKNTQDFLPYLIKMKDGKMRDPKTVKVTDVILAHQSELPSGVVINLDSGAASPDTFLPSIKIGETQTVAISGANISLGAWKLIIGNTDKVIQKAFMVIRFTLGS